MELFDSPPADAVDLVEPIIIAPAAEPAPVEPPGDTIIEPAAAENADAIPAPGKTKPANSPEDLGDGIELF